MASATVQTNSQAPHAPTTGAKLVETKRGKVLIGQLSADFLRLKAPTLPNQVRNDGAVAQQLALRQQQMMAQTARMATANRLTVTVVEAKLNKNYGITKMDPYCRIKVAHSVFETATSQNGAKLPQWGKTVATSVPQDVKDIEIEIFDERAFSTDNKIAWGRIPISDAVKNGKLEDDWWPLSGKLGDEKEGMMHVKLSWAKVQQPVYYNAQMPMMFPQMYNPAIAPMMMPAAQGYVIPPGVPMGGIYPQAQQQQRQVPVITEQDLKQVKEMFPAVEDSVIKTVLEASGGNKDAAINSLLSMQQ